MFVPKLGPLTRQLITYTVACTIFLFIVLLSYYYSYRVSFSNWLHGCCNGDAGGDPNYSS